MQCFIHHLRSLVVEITPLKNMIVISSQNGHLPQIGVKLKILTCNQHPVRHWMIRTVSDSTAALNWTPQNNFDCNEHLHYSANPHPPKKKTHQQIHSKSFTRLHFKNPLCVGFFSKDHPLHNSGYRFKNLPIPWVFSDLFVGRFFFHEEPSVVRWYHLLASISTTFQDGSFLESFQLLGSIRKMWDAPILHGVFSRERGVEMRPTCLQPLSSI